MRVTFDKIDLNEKLTEILRLEGLEVLGEITWSGEAGDPQAQMRIAPLPVRKSPPKAEVEEEEVDDVEVDDPPVRLVAKPKKKVRDLNITPRMQRIQEEIEKEQELIGNPLGSKIVKGKRRMSPNESEEPPLE